MAKKTVKKAVKKVKMKAMKREKAVKKVKHYLIIEDFVLGANKDYIIVRANRELLMAMLENLEVSGAQEIGIPCRELK